MSALQGWRHLFSNCIFNTELEDEGVYGHVVKHVEVLGRWFSGSSCTDLRIWTQTLSRHVGSEHGQVQALMARLALGTWLKRDTGSLAGLPGWNSKFHIQWNTFPQPLKIRQELKRGRTSPPLASATHQQAHPHFCNHLKCQSQVLSPGRLHHILLPCWQMLGKAGVEGECEGTLGSQTQLKQV